MSDEAQYKLLFVCCQAKNYSAEHFLLLADVLREQRGENLHEVGAPVNIKGRGSSFFLSFQVDDYCWLVAVCLLFGLKKTCVTKAGEQDAEGENGLD